jgi:ribose transport system permease protein
MAATTEGVREGPLISLRRTIERNRGSIVSALVFLILLTIYQIQSDRILTPVQARILLNGSLALVLAGVGLTFVIIAGGFDLSVGALMSLGNVLAATLLTGAIERDAFILVAILAIGAFAGFVNGMLVAVTRIQSIIVTLASMFIWSGVALLIMPAPGGIIPGYVSDGFGGKIGTFPIALLWLLGVLAVIGIFRQTPAWDSLFAVGGDEVSAGRTGINTTRSKVLAYTAAGLFYSLAGLSLSAQSTGGDANIGNPFLLTTFAAVVLGGSPLGGGRGTFTGSVFGALVVAILGTVLLSLGVTSYVTDVVQGLVLILAVVAPILISRVASGGAAGMVHGGIAS